MESLIPILASLLSGAVGGNIAGALLKNKSLGVLWNSVVGLLGGGLGGQILGALGLLGGGGLLANVGASTVGGALLLFIVSLFRKAA
jgi:uncharacterized membrane protein YeaQ/YmgE (transglycosylase-associated protein family)